MSGKTRTSNLSKIKSLLEKIKGLVRNKKNAINFQIDGKRIGGESITDLKIEDEKISFVFREDAYDFLVDQVGMIKRLRSRKYMVFINASEEFVESKVEKPVKKVTKKKTTKKNKKEA